MLLDFEHLEFLQDTLGMVYISAPLCLGSQLEKLKVWG